MELPWASRWCGWSPCWDAQTPICWGQVGVCLVRSLEDQWKKVSEKMQFAQIGFLTWEVFFWLRPPIFNIHKKSFKLVSGSYIVLYVAFFFFTGQERQVLNLCNIICLFKKMWYIQQPIRDTPPKMNELNVTWKGSISKRKGLSSNQAVAGNMLVLLQTPLPPKK